MFILALFIPKNNPEGVIMVCPPCSLLNCVLAHLNHAVLAQPVAGTCSLSASVGIHGLTHYATQLNGREIPATYKHKWGSKNTFKVELYIMDSNSQLSYVL